jgi:hypothetical protein
VLRVLPALIAVGLFVYCLVECLQAADYEVRTLPKPAWLFVIVLPVIGPLLWLLAGRPHRARHSRPPRSVAPPRVRGPAAAGRRGPAHVPAGPGRRPRVPGAAAPRAGAAPPAHRAPEGGGRLSRRAARP